MYIKHFLNHNNNLATVNRFLGLVFFTAILLLSSSFSNGDDKEIPGKKIRKVMIDPGHGGTDPGNLCTKRYSEKEKDLALQIALKVGEKIKKDNPDVEVLYTRTEDIFIKLYERTAMANRENVDLFISIHCDAAANKEAKGSSTYVIGPAKTDANLKRAQRENASILKEKDYKKNYSGFDPYSPESYIEMSLRQNSHVVQSLSFAQKVQTHISKDLKRKNRGVKQAPYWVISYTNMPSVLVELGFTTNKEEEDYLRSKKGQANISTAISKAFSEYKVEYEGINEELFDDSSQISTVVKEEIAVVKEDIEVVKIDSESIPVSDDAEIVFKIQIATSSNPMDVKADNFKGLTGVEMYQGGGLYKYTYGKKKSYKKVKVLLSRIKSESYPGAFIVAFKGSKRISLGDALK